MRMEILTMDNLRIIKSTEGGNIDEPMGRY